MPSYRKPPKTSTRTAPDSLRVAYHRAKRTVNEAGFLHEADWQSRLVFDGFTESQLLRESAWVILCCGFRERIVRRTFGYISLCFCDWSSAEEIMKHEDLCQRTALKAIHNEGKIRAIVAVAKRVCDHGFCCVKQRILSAPLVELQEFPYVGPTTARHLAKNLGMDVAKPDRHLSRIAEMAGTGGAQELCSLLSGMTGDPVSVVDVVLWRYATLCPDYKQFGSAAGRTGRRSPAALC